VKAARVGLTFAALCTCLLAVPLSPRAGADQTAYLVNVTVRPGYNFANADNALVYGYGLCDRIAAQRTYGQIIGDIEAHFQHSDEYQASYLITQAVNELCPALIWQLRNSAANYRPSAQ
jgi:hypothetical protein